MDRKLLRWGLFGLLLRLLIMPFTFSGQDIFFIYYSPYKFITHGAWDPYIDLKTTFCAINDPYYAPVIFIAVSLFLFIFLPLLPQAKAIFAGYEVCRSTVGINTAHFSGMFGGRLFRALFLFKVAYLVFDFLTAFLILKFLREKKERETAFAAWMLNPFLMQACYGVGQIDVLMALLICLAVYCVLKKRLNLSMVFLSAAAMTKIFPLILIPFSVLFLGQGLRGRIKLTLSAAGTIVLLIVPFAFSSGGTVLESLFFAPYTTEFLRKAVFILMYVLICALFLFTADQKRSDPDLYIHGLILVMLSFFASMIVNVRYFVAVTPLLVYAAARHPRFWIYNLIFLITLFELRVAGNYEQFGMLAPLHPEFFSSIPSSDSYLNLLIDVKLVHQLCYRVFVGSCLLMMAHIVYLKRFAFKFPKFFRP